MQAFNGAGDTWDANVDELFCIDRQAAAGIPVEHKISCRAERRVLRDPGG